MMNKRRAGLSFIIPHSAFTVPFATSRLALFALLCLTLLAAWQVCLAQQPHPAPAARSTGAKQAAEFPVTFVDAAQGAGLTSPIIYGGVERKRYIIETNGCGVAFFDYDSDGWIDVLLLNGTRLEDFP